MKSSSLENKALQTQLLGSLNKEQPCSPSPWFSLKRGQKAWRGVCCVVNLLWVTDLVVFLMCQVHEEHLEVVGPWAPSVQDAIFPSSSCPTLLSWNCTCSLKVPWAAWLGVGQAEPKWFWKEAAAELSSWELTTRLCRLWLDWVVFLFSWPWGELLNLLVLWFSCLFVCGLWTCVLRGVVVTLRLHPPCKQYSFGVLIKRIIESAELAICWVEAQMEEI